MICWTQCEHQKRIDAIRPEDLSEREKLFTPKLFPPMKNLLKMIRKSIDKQ